VIVKSKTARVFFALASLGLAIGLFVSGVLATLRISANLSGSFIFNVPQGMFHLDVEATMTGHDGEDVKWGHPFNHENVKAVSWDLGKSIHFIENAEGQVNDIIFKFKITNQNEENGTIGNNQVRITYEFVDVSEFISLTPSEDLIPVGGIVIQPLKKLVAGENQEQTDNQTEFEVTLSAIDKNPTQNFEAGFSFRLNFEFVA
jgi:hypothetical protein